jgi:hypothetical protein
MERSRRWRGHLKEDLKPAKPISIVITGDKKVT